MVKSDGLKPEEWEFWDAWMRAQRLLAQQIERRLQHAFGISKAEFSVLVTLLRAPTPEMRVLDVSETLDWEKSRVSHLLTRMERRRFVMRTETGAPGRRTSIALTPEGRQLAENAVDQHADAIRHFFFDSVSTDEAASIRAWSMNMLSRTSDDANSVDGAPTPV